MDTLLRMFGAVWHYRTKLIATVACGLLVSALWSLNISATFPMIKVLFENDSLQAYVDSDISRVQRELAEYEAALQTADRDDIARRAKLQRKLKDFSSQLVFREWLNSEIIPWIPTDRFKTVLLILSLVVFSTLMKGVFVYLQELMVGSLACSTANDVRQQAFSNVMKLDYQSIHSLGTSQITSHLTNDVTVMSDGLRLCCSVLLREPLKAAGCILAALLFNWRLTCISILVLPLIGLIFYQTGRKLRRVATGTMERMGMIYKRIAETFDSSRVVITNNGQEHHRKQLEEANTNFYTNSMQLIRVGAMIKPTIEVLAMVAFIVVLAPGAYLVLNSTDKIAGVKLASGPVSISELTVLYALMVGALDPLRKLTAVFSVAKQSLAAADRIFAITDQETLVQETESPIPFPDQWKQIAFENISFRYHTDAAQLMEQPPALNEVSLCVKRGEAIAVVGGNGSGKSTLLSLLPRLIDPSCGTVRFGDADIRDLSFEALRDRIAVVSQETTLFDDSVLENIRYGNFDADRQAVTEAIHRAHASNFVESLPNGLDTSVGEGGRKLSGGQRQRLALARAIIRDPEILILDEATSAIDSESEDLIHGALQDFRKDRTVFIITHTMSETFLDLVDRVVVMEQGKIVAIGSHETLLDSCDTYRRLVQSGNQPRAAA